MEVEREVDDLLGLLGEVAERIEELESAAGDVDPAVVAGPAPQAAENRNVRAAQALLARERARRMREGLAEIRVQAQRMAALARDASPAPGRATSGAAPRDAVRAFADADDRAAVLAVLVRHVLAVLPDGARVGICAHGPDGALTVETLAEAPDEPLVAELLAAQRVDGGGPIADVTQGGASVRVADLRGDGRRPELARRAEALGVRSLLVRGLTGPRSDAVALVVAGVGVGAAGAVAADVERLADQAEVALAGAARCEGLRRALVSRDLIGQAKGILSHRDGIDADEAFARLVAASQDSNIKLHDVAAWLVGDIRR